MSDAFKKKVHPNPLPRSVEVGAPVRPLAEVRGASTRSTLVPLAVAAALALAGCSTKPAIEREVGHSRTGSTSERQTSPGGGGTDLVDVLKNMIAPEPERPRVAGGAEPQPPTTNAPVNTAAPTAPPPSNTFIAPTPNPPRLAGDVAEPALPPPPSTNATPTNTAPTPTIAPNPGHPKLGGKPVSRPPGGTI